jgi:hypothetical protein
MLWNMCVTEAQNLLLHVSARRGCYHQGVFTAATAVLAGWSVQFHTLAHTVSTINHKNFLATVCVSVSINLLLLLLLVVVVVVVLVVVA